MLEAFGDIWDWHADGVWVAITTNSDIRRDGACVMGRGVALEAKTRYPQLPYQISAGLRHGGNHVQVFPEYRLITLPVKRHWYEQADIELIRQSATELAASSFEINVALVRPGCGNGGLKWDDVKPVIADVLSDDRFIVVERRP